MTGERVKLGDCDPDVIFDVVNAAIRHARRYFRIPDEFETFVFPNPAPDQDSDTPLMTFITPEYLFHEIYVRPDAVKAYALAWKYAGHEIAHLQSRELARLFDDLPDANRDAMRDGIEALTTRLDRMFLRDCPYPGDDHFTAPRGDADGKIQGGDPT